MLANSQMFWDEADAPLDVGKRPLIAADIKARANSLSLKKVTVGPQHSSLDTSSETLCNCPCRYRDCVMQGMIKGKKTTSSFVDLQGIEVTHRTSRKPRACALKRICMTELALIQEYDFHILIQQLGCSFWHHAWID